TKLSPGNVEALTALSKAEQARDQKLAQARQQAETAKQQADLRKLLDGGKANLDAKNYDAAIVALREAVRLDPKNAEAAKLLQDAQKGQAAITLNAQQEAERKRKLDEYQKAMERGRLALSTKQYDLAIAAFRDALKVLPDDKTAAGFIADAEKAKGDAARLLAEETRKREEE